MIRKCRPDVVHSHMWHANLLARAVRLVTPVPALVSTIHNIYEGGPLRMAAYRLTNSLTDHITIISQVAADRFIRERIVPEELVTVIPNGVDPELFRNVPPGTREELRSSLGLGERFVWLAVGRFETAKENPTCCVRRQGAQNGIRTPSSCSSAGARSRHETEALVGELRRTSRCDSSASATTCRRWRTPPMGT